MGERALLGCNGEHLFILSRQPWTLSLFFFDFQLPGASVDQDIMTCFQSTVMRYGSPSINQLPAMRTQAYVRAVNFTCMLALGTFASGVSRTCFTGETDTDHMTQRQTPSASPTNGRGDGSSRHVHRVSGGPWLDVYVPAQGGNQPVAPR